MAIIAMGLVVVWSAWPVASAQGEGASRTRSFLSGRIDSNFTHSCAIAADGTLHCWGEGIHGELGYGNKNSIGDNELPSAAGAVNLGGHTAIAVSAGDNHTCAILDDHTVRCWGGNEFGQLGYGNTEDRLTPGSVGPVDLGAGRTAVEISVGGDHTCAILDNGTVRCWGVGSAGQLGYGTPINILGDNETPGSFGPVDLGAGRTAVAISTGRSHTCAILDNGTVRCWGHGIALGYGISPNIGDNETPGSVGPVNLGGHSAVAITAGISYTCAILDNGTVHCWGVGTNGQLGYGNTAESSTPGGDVDLGVGRKAVAITASGTAEVNHTCALLDNGTVRCWGSGANGRLGYGNTATIGDNETPGSVGPVNLGTGRNAIGVSAGEGFTCALLDNGTVRCWGSGANGRLGYGNTTAIGDNEAPGSVGPVALGVATVGRFATAVSSSGSHACAILDNGTVRCWGSGANGRLGYGNTTTIGDNEAPGSVGPVDLDSGRTAVAIAAGGSHTCAIHDNGTVRCWGSGDNGQLGYGNTADIGDNETPAAAGPVEMGGRNAVAITAGNEFTCAILDDGTVRCWGDASFGQLGYGNTNNIGDNELPSTAGPVDLGAGRTAIAVDAGDRYVCALLDNGTVRCWGRGTFGALGYGESSAIGDNEAPGSVGPVDLGAGRTAVAITAGGNHTCVRLDNGTVRCWGSGANGRLGYGNTTTIGDNEAPGSVGPVDLDSGRTAVAIAAGGSHTCAIHDNGTVRCWGSGDNGQLGYGNTADIGDNELPSAVGTVDLGVSRFARILTGGTSHTCVLLDNGTVRCWGSGSSGQLGYGNTDAIGDNELPSASGPVDSLDDLPVAVNDSASVNRNASATAIDVLANDTDIDAGPKSVASKTEGAHGVVAITGGGSGLTYTPVANYCGADSFTYTLNGGSKATVSITVTCDDPPVAVNDSDSLVEDSPATAIDVLANDTDIDGGPKSVASKTDGTHGTVAIAGAGLTYQPAANYCGPDSFTYTLNGGSSATVSMTVTCVDDPPTAVNDSATLSEDASATAIDVLSNDTDADGGLAKSIAAKTDGAHGTVVITGEGTGLTYAPESNYCGSDSFTYTLNGGATATVNVTITCADDDPPVAVNDSATVNEDVSATAIDVLANDTDIDAGPKSVASKTDGTHGVVAITGGGAGLTYTPAANYCGADSFTYTLNGGSTATVSVTVTCVDDLPVAVDDSETLAEDAAATAIDVLANDTDTDAGPKSVASKTEGTHGTVAITGGGTGLTYQPEANYCGPDSFTYTLSGGSSATVSITVTCVDDLPVAVNDSATLAEDASATAIDVLANDTDIDAGLKSVASKTEGAHGVVAITGGGTGLTYTPDANDCGPDSFTYTLSGGSIATVSVTVTCVDDPPAAVNDSETLAEDSLATTIDVLANDTDIDAGLKSVASKTEGAHGVVAITGGGTGLTYTPAPNYCGPDSFTYTLNGGSKATVNITVTCADDDPPVAVDDSATLNEDASATAVDVLANDTDIDGGPKSVASKTDGTHGTVAIIGGGTGLTYAPDANYCGADSFTYTLNGGSTASVSVTITCVDDAPSAVDDSTTLTEGASATAIDVLANDTDSDAGPKSVASKTNGSHGTVAIAGGGTGLTYQPDSNYCGLDSFTYTLNGGSSATVSITVTCVDDPPVAVDDSATLVEDDSATAIDVLANDTDIDAGLKSVASKTEGAHGVVAITGGGAGLTYTPAANYCGADSFTYTLNGGSVATVSMAVTCVDDPPTAVNDSAILGEDASATAIDVLANDTDIDAGPKSVASKTEGAHGVVAITGGGTGLTYQPEANYCGPDSFTYTLNGGSVATVSMAVTCVDDPPTAVNDSAILAEDSPATAIDVLANDTDIDAGLKSVASKANGTHGIVAITGTGLTYQPEANYCGSDSFTYTLNGGSSATVSVTVTCVDDLPTAINDSATLAEDASPAAIDVLANDTDSDAGPKSVASKTNGAHGAVSITGEGTGLTYAPAANYCGSDSFTYTLNGGSTATISVTVTCVDDSPVAVNDSATVNEDVSATAIDVLANDTDIDAGLKSVASKTEGAHGVVAITGGGAGLTYTPAANYCGADSFTYTLNGGSVATVSMAVTCVDDPPTAVNDSAILGEDASATAIDVLVNDTDTDAGPKSVASKTEGAHGVVAITGGGAGLTYTPAANYCGPDSFTYTLNGGSTATVSVTATCVDDSPEPTTEETLPPGFGVNQNSIPPTSSASIINVTPGVGVVSRNRHPRIAIKGIYAFFTLACKPTDKDCVGTVTITASIPNVGLKPTIDRVKLVRGKFRLGPGRSVLVRAKLTRIGRDVLESKQSLRGVGARMAIADGNGGKGEIEVNLVRRPKASLLPGAA